MILDKLLLLVVVVVLLAAYWPPCSATLSKRDKKSVKKESKNVEKVGRDSVSMEIAYIYCL